MKKKYLFVIIIVLLLIGVVAEELNKDISIAIKISKYPIEGRNVDIKFYIWNKGNVTFNGTAIYDFSSEEMFWKEEQKNITISPNNYTLLETSKNPSYPGLYWAKIKIKDSESRQIYQTQGSFNVHSYGETATIGALILGVLSFIAYLIFKKK